MGLPEDHFSEADFLEMDNLLRSVTEPKACGNAICWDLSVNEACPSWQQCEKTACELSDRDHCKTCGHTQLCHSTMGL
jgi:hypothetical protein